MFEYNLDISERSYMRDYTLSARESRFNTVMIENGYFEAGEDYYTTRDDKQAALMIFTESGAGVLETQKQKYLLTSGKAIIFKCNEYHSYRTAPGESKWNFYWAHFSLDALNGFEDLITDTLLEIRDEDLVRIKEVFFKIDELSGRSDVFASGCRSVCVSELIGVMLSSAEKTNGRNRQKSEEIDRVIEYIDSRLSERITVDELADICHLSKYHFIRLFHKCTGLSPYKYIMVARINKSKVLLTTTRMPISEVAEASGFLETANFSKVFKNITGVMPTVYRRDHYRL